MNLDTVQMSRVVDGVLPLIGRILLCLVFLPAALAKTVAWSSNAEYMRSHGMVMVAPLLAVALVIEAVGPLCVIAGFHARVAAFVMALYLVPVSIIFHTGQAAAGFGYTGFLKNLGILGGLVMVATYGPGTISVDAWRARAPARRR